MFGHMDLHSAGAGKKTGYIWHFNPRPDAAEGRVGVPIGMIGSGEGPIALLIGATHADEYIGPALINDIFHSIDPKDVIGTIITVPSSNITGIMNGSRFAPEDGKNFNRLYPGNPGGTLSERICHSINKELIGKSHMVLDIHSGGRSLEFIPGALLRLHGEKSIDQKSWHLAQAFGAEVTYISPAAPTHAAHVSAMANQAGIPSIATELGGSEFLEPAALEAGISGIFNVLRTAGVLKGDAKIGKTRPIHLKHVTYASEDGLFVSKDALGTRVKKGDIAGYLRDATSLKTKPVPIEYAGNGIFACRRRVALSRRGDSLVQVAHDLSGRLGGFNLR